jgi:hypothetical protein
VYAVVPQFSETVIVTCVKIRYQEATSGECNRLRTLVRVDR